MKTPRSAFLLTGSPLKKVVENQIEPGENSSVYKQVAVHEISGNVAVLSPLLVLFAHDLHQEVPHHLQLVGEQVRYHLLHQ